MKKGDKIIPLEQHKLVIKKMSENGGKKLALSKAMEAAGYSKEYSKNPQKLKKTKSWNALMEEYLPDDFLSKRHKALLAKQEVIPYKDEDGAFHVHRTGQPHSDAKQALDMAYKLKSKYAAEELDIKFRGFNKQQLIDLIAGKIGKKK